VTAGGEVIAGAGKEGGCLHCVTQPASQLSSRLPRPTFALPLPELLCLPSLPPAFTAALLPHNIPVPPALVMDITLLMYLPSRSWRRNTLKRRTLLMYGHILGGEIHSHITLR
jgi:hypothetical protein